MTPRERSQAAEKLKNNPLLAEILNNADANTVAAWRAEQDPAKREMLWSRNQALTLLRSDLNGSIERALRDGREQQPGE